jgi:glycosyltransferase involved in cell wall biosynthesis
MKCPLISIITPAYKAKETILRAFTSVLQQDFPEWELIIISDDGQDYGQFFADNHIIDERLVFTSTAKIRSGSSNARNKGIEIARGRYIACLDADDTFKPQKLSAMIPLVEKYGAAVSDIEIRDNDTNLLLEKFNQTSSNDFLTPQDLPWVCVHTCSLYLCDRTKVPDLLYNIDFPRMQDFVFLMSFFNNLEVIGFTPEPLHVYYKREGSSCNSTDTHVMFHQSKLNFLEKLTSENISIKNELAKAEAKRLIDFSLAIDDIYDQEFVNNPTVDWEDIFKRKQALNVLIPPIQI